MTDSELLCAAGAALHGPLWQNALAGALGVNPRTMRRWAAGMMPVPPGIFEKLHTRMELRTATLLTELRSRSRPR